MGALCQIWLTLVHWFYSGRFKNKIYVFSLFSHIGEGGLLSVRQTWIPYTQGYFIPSLVENYSVFLKKLKTKSMYFRYFVIISSCKSAGHLNWTNVNPLHQWMFFLSLVEIGLVVLEKKIFIQFISDISLISPLGKRRTLFWTKFNPLHPKILCAKFRGTLLNCFEDFFFLVFSWFFFNVCSLNGYNLSLKIGRGLQLTKLEPPSPKDALCQGWLKISKSVWRSRRKWEKF